MTKKRRYSSLSRSTIYIGVALIVIVLVAGVILASQQKITNMQDLSAAMTIVYGGLGLVAIIIYGDQLLISRNSYMHQERVSRAGFVRDLVSSFFSNHNERLFFYKLDYAKWEFIPDKYRMSDDEVLLDNLFYRLSYVGILVKEGLLDADDVYILRFILRELIHNEEIQKYLVWVHKDIPASQDLAYGYTLYLYWRIYGMTPQLKMLSEKAPDLFLPPNTDALK